MGSLRAQSRRLLKIAALAAIAGGWMLPSACAGPAFSSCADGKTCSAPGASSNPGGVIPPGGDSGSAGDTETPDGAGSTGGSGGSEVASSAGAAGTRPCDGHCKRATPVCEPVSNECVQCLKSTDCNVLKPACDTATNSCVECTASTDCEDASKPFCETKAHACVSCLKQADCIASTASACIAGACVACTKDEECSNIPGKGVCDAGTCVQCTGKKFAACGQDSGTPLVCDSLKRSCSTSKQQSAGLCETCVSDAQCNPGQMCVLDKFGNPAKDVGYFCHWKKGDPAGGAPTDCFATGKPYSDTKLAVISIDGSVSDICSLRTSTCTARNQAGVKDCGVASAPSDAACGFAPGEDSKCVQVSSSSSYRCTMTCLLPEDCPGMNSTCKTGAAPPVCTFN